MILTFISPDRMIWMIISVNLINGMQEMKPIVIEDQGVVLNPKGMVVLPSEYVHTSLMIKLKKPTLLETDDNCQKKCKMEEINKVITDIQCKQIRKEPGNTAYKIYDTTEEQTKNKTELDCLQNCSNNRGCKWIRLTENSCMLYEDGELLESRESITTDAKCLWRLLEQEAFCSINQKDIFTKSLTKQFYNEIDKFWEEMESLLDSLVVKQQKQKRQVGVLMGAAGIVTSLISTGFNYYMNKQINSKIKKMRKDFEAFAKNVQAWEKNTYDFDREILRIVDAEGKNQKIEFEVLDCKTDTLALKILQHNQIEEFKNKVKELLKPLYEGKRTGYLNTNLLNNTEVKMLIKQHPTLKHTMYNVQPTLIYPTSKSTIAELYKNDDADTVTIHIIITTPILKEEQIFQYFKTAQTGFYYNDKCWKHDIPDKVYQKIIMNETSNNENRGFYSLDNVHCEGGSELFMSCDLNLTTSDTNPLKVMKVECLSEELNKCNIIQIKCKEEMIYSIHGLLTRSDKQIKGILRKIEDEKKIQLWKPETSSTRVKYWSWKKFEYVELDSGVARATIFFQEIATLNLKQQKAWWEKLRETDTNITANNLTKAYLYLNKSLNILNKQIQWGEGNEIPESIKIYSLH